MISGCIINVPDGWIKKRYNIRYCPNCGAKRHLVDSVELPEKMGGLHSDIALSNSDRRINEIISYLESKPWESK